MQTKNRIFYGWKVVAVSIIILAVAQGMFYSTNSVFVIPVCKSLGFLRGPFTLYRSIITLSSACAMPFYGRIIKRFGVKKMLLTGAVALSAVTAGYSFANSLWYFYILAFVNGVFFNAVSYMGIGIIISSWFDDKRGLATGLAFSGSGIGGAIMIPLISQIIGITDWRFAYRLMGIVGAVILIPIILLVIKDTPEEKGLKPYTSAKPNKDGRKASYGTSFSLSLGQSIKTSRFWLLLVSFLLISAFAGAVNTHSTPFLIGIGYSVGMVSALMSLFMLVDLFGKIIIGIIYDRFGSLVGIIIISVSCVIFPIAALLSHIPIFPWVYAVTVGVACSGVTVPMTTLVAKYFGDKDYPNIFSIFVLVTSLGPSVSVPTMGATYDKTGSYQLAWVAFLVFSIIISICIVAAELTYRKDLKKLRTVVDSGSDQISSRL